MSTCTFFITMLQYGIVYQVSMDIRRQSPVIAPHKQELIQLFNSKLLFVGIFCIFYLSLYIFSNSQNLVLFYLSLLT
jgi:hypothetical protein